MVLSLFCSFFIYSLFRAKNNKLIDNENSISLSSTDCIDITVSSPIEINNLDHSDRLVQIQQGIEFEIILLLDSRENMPGEKKRKLNTFREQLIKNHIKCETRPLSLSDITWIIRSKNNPANEFVLNYYIERKTVRDLVYSYSDGRFSEQKWRLKTHCKDGTIIYLIEGNFSDLRDSANEKFEENSILKSIQMTQINDNFTTKICSNFEETIKYLKQITFHLAKKWLHKKLYEITQSCKSFRLFSKLTSKVNNLTVSDIFAKQLLQIHHLGPSKAKTIIEHYPTLPSLLNTYDLLDKESKQALLKNLMSEGEKHSVGARISELLYNIYTTK